MQKVLIILDSEDNRREYFESDSFKKEFIVKFAEDKEGKKLIDLIEKEKFDILLCHLRDVGGPVQAVSLIKRIPSKNLPSVRLGVSGGNLSPADRTKINNEKCFHECVSWYFFQEKGYLQGFKELLMDVEIGGSKERACEYSLEILNFLAFPNDNSIQSAKDQWKCLKEFVERYNQIKKDEHIKIDEQKVEGILNEIKGNFVNANFLINDEYKGVLESLQDELLNPTFY